MYGSALGAELGDVGNKARHERHVARESVQLGDHHRLTVGFRHQDALKRSFPLASLTIEIAMRTRNTFINPAFVAIIVALLTTGVAILTSGPIALRPQLAQLRGPGEESPAIAREQQQVGDDVVTVVDTPSYARPQTSASTELPGPVEPSNSVPGAVEPSSSIEMPRAVEPSGSTQMPSPVERSGLGNV